MFYRWGAVRPLPNAASLGGAEMVDVSQRHADVEDDVLFMRARGLMDSPGKVQITFIFIGQTRLVFGNCVCTCATKHSNAFRTFLNWLKNSKRVWHEPKLHISRLPLFANFDL